MGKIINGTDVWYLNAVKKIYISDLTVDGTHKRPTTNGKIVFDCESAVFKNINLTKECTVYNVFEQVQTKTAIKDVKMKNVKAFPSLAHNILNLYNIADNATIEISDCDLDLNVANTNPVRLSNLSNASNVTITFKNVNWTYDNMAITEDGKKWAGLVLIQPFSTDKADFRRKDTDYTLDFYKSWTFIFDNCTYNGEKVTANNFGTKQQVICLCDINADAQVEDVETLGFKMTFK